MSTFCYQSSIYSPYKAVWRIFKLILDACRISFNALNYIFVSWLFVMFIESCTWSIENTKQQIIRDKMLIALLMNLFTFYSRSHQSLSHLLLRTLVEMSWKQIALVHIELFAGTLKILNNRMLILLDRGGIRRIKKGNLYLFFKNLMCKCIILNCYIQI